MIPLIASAVLVMALVLGMATGGFSVPARAPTTQVSARQASLLARQMPSYGRIKRTRHSTSYGGVVMTKPGMEGRALASLGLTATILAGQRHWQELGVAPRMGDVSGDKFWYTEGDEVRARIMRNWQALHGEAFEEAIRAMGKGHSVWGATASTDLGTLPIFADPKFHDLTTKDIVVTPGIPDEPINEKSFTWDPITASDAAVFDTSEFPTITEQDDTVTPQTRNVSLMFARVRISGLAERVSQGFGVNLMTDRMARRVQAMRELKEATTIEGDGTGGSYKGFTTSFTDNVKDLATVTLTLADLDDVLLLAEDNGGRPDQGVAPHAVVNKIAALQEAAGIQRLELTPTTMGISGWLGRSNMVIHNGILIKGTRLMNNGVGTRNLVFYQEDLLSHPTLLGISSMDLGVTTDAKDVLLKTYFGLKDEAANAVAGDGTGGQHHAVVKNIGV